MLDAAASDRQILHVSAVAAPEELLKYLSATQQRRAEGHDCRGTRLRSAALQLDRGCGHPSWGSPPKAMRQAQDLQDVRSRGGAGLHDGAVSLARWMWVTISGRSIAYYGW